MRVCCSEHRVARLGFTMLLSQDWLWSSALFASKASSDGKRQHLGLQTALMAGFQALGLQYLFNKELFDI